MGTTINKMERNSNIELFRVLVMLGIVAHHFVVNSGVQEMLTCNYSDWRSMFLWLFGAWGKVGINCFVLITGYFMCFSQISLRKFLKLVFEIEFYRIAIYTLFLLAGKDELSFLRVYEVLMPIRNFEKDFFSCYLVFYLFIPFLNITIKAMDKKQHLSLIGLSLLFFTIFDQFPNITIPMGYPVWFMVIYLIGAYLRMYKFENRITQFALRGGNLWMLILAIASIYCTVGLNMLGIVHWWPLHWVIDCNTPCAVLASVVLFNYFRQLKIKQNKWINMLGASSFGVLLIHAHSDTMRAWLWGGIVDVVGHFASCLIPFYAIGSVMAVYIICSIIDQIRINTVEKYTLKLIDKFVII